MMHRKAEQREIKMGRGKSKIEIKAIESLAARNVCFTKRRNGLFKKASELCRLFPGVKVAAAVFSPAGKPYVYGDPNGIFESQQQGAWNSVGGALADEVIEEVIRGVQLQAGGCPSPSSVLAGGLEPSPILGSMIPELEGEYSSVLPSSSSQQGTTTLTEEDQDVASLIQELLW
ncbi:unnamed protein product [Cuscuta epithymum]|uniref:MADS-box domain-containing protein n=1 Tax=Cuscuta epithymum TaxID=186058 RepID=A0AAV0D3F9_9ASTE|nr:unnamed protein product [Cuscuta epithymum]